MAASCRLGLLLTTLGITLYGCGPDGTLSDEEQAAGGVAAVDEHSIFWLGQAKVTAEAIIEPFDRAVAYADVAMAYSDLGDAASASETFRAAHVAARSVKNPETRRWIQESIRGGQISAGDAQGLYDFFDSAGPDGDYEAPEWEAHKQLMLASAYLNAKETVGARTSASSALSAAVQMGDAEARIAVLGQLVEIQTQIDFQLALETASQIADEAGSSAAYERVSLLRAQVGDFDGALNDAWHIGDPEVRSSTLAFIAKALADAGDVKRARAIAAQVEAETSPMSAFVAGEALEATGDSEGAGKQFERAVAAASRLADPERRAALFTMIVAGHAARGDCGAAIDLTRQYLPSEGELGLWRVMAYQLVATSHAEAQRYGAAREAAEESKDRAVVAETYALIARAQVRTGDDKAANHTLSDLLKIVQSSEWASPAISGAFAEAGDFEGARACVDHIPWIADRASALRTLACHLSRTGGTSKICEWLDSTVDPRVRVQIQIGVARGQCKSCDCDQPGARN